MATNPYINRVDVVRGNSTDTLINISDTTAVASDVASGKYFYLASGEKVAGTSSGGGSVTQDSNGFIVLPETGGGGSGDSWSWMGKNPTLIKAYAKEKVYFKDTDFPSWTWSTTASDIVAATAYGETVTVDLTQYDCFVVYKFHAHYEYGNWTPVSAINDYAFVLAANVYGYYSTVSAEQSGVYDYSTQSNLSRYYCNYKNSSGNSSIIEAGCGLFANSNISISSSGAISSRTLTLTKPKLRAQGINGVFTQDAFNACDMNTSYYEILTEVWRVDSRTSDMASVYDMMLDALDNGL